MIIFTNHDPDGKRRVGNRDHSDGVQLWAVSCYLLGISEEHGDGKVRHYRATKCFLLPSFTKRQLSPILSSLIEPTGDV